MTEAGEIWPDLEEGEIVLAAADDLLWRQVHPEFVQGGQLASRAFRLNSGDAKRLSLSWAKKQSAEGAYDFHANVLKLPSAGTWAVSVGEVLEAGCRAIYDEEAASAPPAPCPPGHTFIDLRPFGSSRISKITKKLNLYAQERGRIHP